ncbi:MAG: hypothetical protein JW727_02880 [Candidatus Aenigmarchaeota archaeon]|nr:hypothetical protein [Candidatus Aenigmarchaeota archaeon]
MEMSAKLVVEIVLFLIVISVVLYVFIDKMILGGTNSIFGIGADWLKKVFNV